MENEDIQNTNDNAEQGLLALSDTEMTSGAKSLKRIDELTALCANSLSMNLSLRPKAGALDVYAQAIEREKFLSLLCSKLFSQKMRALYVHAAQSQAESESARWFCLRHKETAEELFLGFEWSVSKRLSQQNYYWMLFRLAVLLSASAAAKGADLVDAAQNSCPYYQGIELKPGSLILIENVQHKPQRYDRYQLLKNSANQVGPQALLFSQAGAHSSLCSSLIICMEEGQKMMEEDEIEVSLNLGKLELGLPDLLRLREGMQIEFEKPQVFEGSLQIEGVDWARVEISLGESQINLDIKEIMSFKRSQSVSSGRSVSNENNSSIVENENNFSKEETFRGLCANR